MGNNRNLRFAVRAALATAAAAAAFVPTAQSQTAPPAGSTAPADTGLAEVVVTGSRLQQAPNDVSISPVTSITQVEIQQTGLVRVEDLLNNLPSVVAENSSGQSISSNGTATVSLRGLGSQRTLVLVDGFRLSPGGGLGTYSQPDLNQVPAALIQRVDVLTGGASSVYGADAVAGVVNFVLNNHFEGVQIDGNYGFAHHSNNNSTALGDLAAANDQAPPSSVNAGYNKDLSIIIGSNFADGRGNATAYFTYLNTSPVVGSQYDYAGCTLNTPGSLPSTKSYACGGSSSSATGRFIDFGSNSTTAFNAIADATVDAKTGQFRPYSGATDSYNYGALSYLQREAQRYTAGSFINFDVNENTNVYSEFMFARNTSTAQYGPSGLFAFGTPVISCSNPLLTPNELSQLCTPAAIAANQATWGLANGSGNPLGGNPNVTGNNILLYIARRSVESGPRLDNYSSNAFHEVLGLKGKFGDAWNYNAYAQVGITENEDYEGGFLGVTQIDRALNVVTDPKTGKPVCAAALNGDDPACVPWNIWSPGGVTQAALNYLETPATYTVTATEYIAHADVSGDLGKYNLQVPTASSGVQLNVGTEYRQENYVFSPDIVYETGNNSGGNGVFPPIDKGFHVFEGFTEFRVPLINDKIAAEDVAFEGGYRYSSYTTGFDTNTFKLGLEWAPLQDVKLRGGYNRAIRAPNIGDLYAPPVISSGGAADPCWGPSTDAANPTLGTVQGHSFAYCQNTGVTAAEFGHILANPAAQINTSGGGNSTLTPEKADTYTLGLVLQPSAIPNLVTSFDFYIIKIKNTIEQLTSNTIIQDCGSTGLASLCDLIHRGGGTGSLWFNNTQFVNTNSQNIGVISTRGIDLNAHYRLDMGSFGKLGFTLTGTEVINFDTQPIASIPGSYDCAGYFGSTCGSPTPHWRHVLATNWSTPWYGLDLTARWRYIGPVDSDRSSSNPQLEQTYFEPTSHNGGYSYLDLSASIPLSTSGVSVRVGVNNLTDKPPPIVLSGNYTDCPTATCNDNTWVGTYDTLGRYMYAHVTAKF